MSPSAFVLAVLACCPLAKAQEPGSFVIRDVRVFDGERLQENRTVVVSNGIIDRVGGPNLRAAGLEVVDGRGYTLVPGLIDSHVHLPGYQPESALAQFAALGVTTVVDMFSAGKTFEAIKAIKTRDEPQYASVVTSGTGATAPGGHPSQLQPTTFPTIDKPEQAREFVAARLAEGSEFIKIIYDDLAEYRAAVPTIDEATLRSLVEAAHDRGAMAIAHIGSEADARAVIAAGVDGLAHLFAASEVSADFGELAARAGVFVIPTLSVLHSACGRPDGPDLVKDEWLGPFVGPQWRQLATLTLTTTGSCASLGPTLRQLADADVPLLAGTDAPTPGTAYGASLHGELEAMVEYGMTPIQALTAATSIPARVFGLNDRGRIESGRRADLLLVEGDPTEDIRATRRIVRVWKSGVPIDRKRFD
ncbi:MAG TPA: amidohydrolase family protein [Gammaproteobacteria bacterium]